MRIVTQFVFPPIPSRSMDWSAVDDDTYDYDKPVGRGATEREAIETAKKLRSAEIDRLWKEIDALDDRMEALELAEQDSI